MKPISFEGQNIVIAKNQQPYLPLPAFVDGLCATTCWSLSFKERIIVLFTGRIWHKLMHFGQPLQPQKISARRKLI